MPDDECSSAPTPRPHAGPVWRHAYAGNPKHASVDRGRVSRRPHHPQDTLDYSVAARASGAVRIGIDYDDAAFVVFRLHERGPITGWTGAGEFHGYAVVWARLPQELGNTLIRAGMADRKGRIL